jgi:hypothetical protein
MDTRTGAVYPSVAEALKAGVPERDVVEVQGTPAAIARLRRRLAEAHKAREREARRRKRARQQARASRKRNR